VFWQVQFFEHADAGARRVRSVGVCLLCRWTSAWASVVMLTESDRKMIGRNGFGRGKQQRRRRILGISTGYQWVVQFASQSLKVTSFLVLRSFHSPNIDKSQRSSPRSKPSRPRPQQRFTLFPRRCDRRYRTIGLVTLFDHWQPPGAARQYLPEMRPWPLWWVNRGVDAGVRGSAPRSSLHRVVHEQISISLSDH
jgi:hypothetical protein